MKKCCLIFVLVVLAVVTQAQNNADTIPPFKRFPTVPPFRLLETDSISILTKADIKKNKAVLLILFNPECDHCKHETEEIIKHIDAFKKVQIVMATMAQYNLMKDFYFHYKLNEFNNIHVGQDFQYLLPSFYMIRSLPFLAMYDKKGKLITTFEGSMKIDDLINIFK